MSEQNPESIHEEVEEIPISADELLEAAIGPIERNFNIMAPYIANPANSTVIVASAETTNPISNNEANFAGNLYVSDASDVEMNSDDDNAIIDPEIYQRNLDRVNEYIAGVIAHQELAEKLAQIVEPTNFVARPAIKFSGSATDSVGSAIQSVLSAAQISGGSTNPLAGSIDQLINSDSAVPSESSNMNNAIVSQDPQEYVKLMRATYIRVTFVLPDNTCYTIFLLRSLNYNGLVEALKRQLPPTFNFNRIIFELRCLNPRLNLGKMPRNWTLVDLPQSIVIQVLFIYVEL